MSLDLFDEIIPDKSKISVLLNKIELIMEKKNVNISWKRLESENDLGIIETENTT